MIFVLFSHLLKPFAEFNTDNVLSFNIVLKLIPETETKLSQN